MIKFKFSPYSTSKQQVHSQCPQKFKFIYIDGIKRFKTSLPLIKGSYIHKVIEHNFDYKVDFELDEIFTKEERLKADKLIKRFEKGLGSKYKDIMAESDLSPIHEERFAWKLSKDSKKLVELCAYWEYSAWLRGALDFQYVVKELENSDDLTAYNIDWKSGKSKVNDRFSKDFGKEQARNYSVYLFLKYPNVKKVISRFVFVEHNNEMERIYYREDLTKLLIEILKETKVIEKDEKYLPNVTKLCDWCDYKDLCSEFSEENKQVIES